MNVVFISPQFPENYYNFCGRLRGLGVNVLGIGDTPYDEIAPELKAALTEYYWLPSLEDYDEVFRACGYLTWKHGKIDWIESNNEHWLSLDARLRDDFNVKTGAGAELMTRWQSKAAMKPLYAKGNVPTARQCSSISADVLVAFGREVGFPLFAKPEQGVGSGGVVKINNEAELIAFANDPAHANYVVEEYVTGDICSWDAILNSQGEVLFENQEEFPPSMADVVEQELDMIYLSRPQVDPKLAALGRATLEAFGLRSRFVHMEFFRLQKNHPGLGKRGDYVGLEVNVRPPGGFTPDMMNFAHSCDVYQIWAEMLVFDERKSTGANDDAWCVYVGRRDNKSYVHSREEVLARYENSLVMNVRIPDGLADDLGNEAFIARLKTPQACNAFKRYVSERLDEKALEKAAETNSTEAVAREAEHKVEGASVSKAKRKG